MPVKLRWQALPLAFASVRHIYRAELEEDDGVSGLGSCPGGAEAFTVQFENGETCQYASMRGAAIQSPEGL